MKQTKFLRNVSTASLIASDRMALAFFYSSTSDIIRRSSPPPPINSFRVVPHKEQKQTPPRASVSDENDRDSTDGTILVGELSGRRDFMHKISTTLLGTSFVSLLHANEARAACLQGDIRTECVGVYKMPLDDAALPYVETPEQLKKFAPDLQWVQPIKYPKSYADAVTQLKQQRVSFNTARESIAKGDMNQGGLVLLDVVPKVNAAGKVIVQSFTNAGEMERNKTMKKVKDIGIEEVDSSSSKSTNLDMKAYRIDYALNELLGFLGEADVLIGQGMRGQLGVSAPAQIQILSTIGEAEKEFDELLRAVPDKL